MKIIYFSFTGNVRRFIKRTELENTLEITAENCMEPVHEPFIIVTGTIGFGEVPEPVQSFQKLIINTSEVWQLAVIEIGD